MFSPGTAWNRNNNIIMGLTTACAMAGILPKPRRRSSGNFLSRRSPHVNTVDFESVSSTLCFWPLSCTWWIIPWNWHSFAQSLLDEFSQWCRSPPSGEAELKIGVRRALYTLITRPSHLVSSVPARKASRYLPPAPPTS
ncbi:hypothetical protein Hypma_001060 [Hypsizygus marmoreus]|uniref:Uncharacterized protein n=1 Tax=Hypsizygus marmoreus TaxID=39966 RepID=A0A369JB17_HYPMA|nr:hypothetical protein Hypma_001060 [Hypsizygus marmoreus]